MPRKLLVVEDSEFQAEMISGDLKAAGFEVNVACDGVECLGKVKEIKPDLIVLDILMPRMDGYETCRHLKADRETAAIPVVFLTQENRVGDIVHGLEVGGDNFITKPYEAHYLIERVNAIFENQQLRAKGELPQDIAIERFSDEIVLTRDREQIFELLLKSLNTTLAVELVGLIILKGEPQAFLVTSIANLSDKVQNHFIEGMLTALNEFLDEPISADALKPRLIESRMAASELEGEFKSYIHVPLLAGGKITGIFSATNSGENAFAPDDVRYLFSVGAQCVTALSKVTKPQ